MATPELVVMLTHHDCTVDNAATIFEQCKHSKAQYWGFKEKPLPLEQMKAVFAAMKACGKTTVLEVVEYTEAEGLEGAEIGAACGVDILMGTVYSDSIRDYCRAHNMRYMPFVGEIRERPSILEGTPEAMIEQARYCLARGVAGFDLLAYRYTGDVEALISRFVKEVKAPVCIAGSVDSYEKLDFLKQTEPWSFTIGGAFFDHCFGEEICEQINTVCDYLKK